MYAVVAGSYREAAAGDIDRAEGVILVVFGVETVLSGADGDAAVRDRYAVIGLYRVGARGDGDNAAGYYELILADYAVLRGGDDGERARAVYREIVLGEYRAVDAVIVPLRERAAVCKLVLRALGKRYEDLVGLLDVYRRVGIGADADAVQHELYLVLIGRVDYHAAV